MDEQREIKAAQVQKSFQHHQTGTLYLVATPIGNLEDMTYRAIRILREVDEVAAEDTRQTRKLFTHFDIQTKLSSYHEHNKQQAGKRIIDSLLAGESLALVSDAGFPAISDPGSELVHDAVAHDITVVPIPGANAALSALIVSGLPTTQFSFVGFLPRENKARKEKLQALRNRLDTHIFYESPYRIVKTLQAIETSWGERTIALARELTKKYEEIVRGSIRACLAYLKNHPPRGEYCIVVEGSQQTDVADEWWSTMTIVDHVGHYERGGIDRKQAIKMTALDRRIPRREVYQVIHRPTQE